jgi:tetrahydromethanopterin S-methyltransferase subunit B
MKINELIKSFDIYLTNEEKSLLETFNKPLPMNSFPEREQVILTNLIRKSVVSKVLCNGTVMVMPNDLS